MDSINSSDINDLHNRAPAFQQNRPEGLTSIDHDYAIHQQKLGDRAPMNALHALTVRCCFRYDHLMFSVEGHGITNCKHAPSVQELAGLDRST